MNTAEKFKSLSDIYNNIEPTEIIVDLEDIPHAELVRLLDNALKELQGKQEQVLRMRFGLRTDKKNLQEVADFLSMSRERVRQTEQKAFRALKNSRSMLFNPPT